MLCHISVRMHCLFCSLQTLTYLYAEEKKLSSRNSKILASWTSASLGVQKSSTPMDQIRALQSYSRPQPTCDGRNAALTTEVLYLCQACTTSGGRSTRISRRTTTALILHVCPRAEGPPLYMVNASPAVSAHHSLRCQSLAQTISKKPCCFSMLSMLAVALSTP